MNKNTTYTEMEWKNNSLHPPASSDLMYATEEPEFFYKSTREVVPEGEPIGLDVDTKNGVKLVLFSDIYWNPATEE